MKKYVTAFIAIALAGLVLGVSAQTQKARATAVDKPVAQQPLYTDFRGVKLGMAAEEVRAKLGTPVLKDAEMDYFVLSETVSAQVVYDTAHKVRTISVDFAGAAGAPEARAVVGPEVAAKADGSIYGMVRYDAQGFWVAYNRTAGPVIIVTITLQKI